MGPLLDAPVLALPLGYLIATVAYVYLFVRQGRGARAVATALLVLVLALHLGHLRAVTLESGRFPAVTVAQILALTGFALAAAYLAVEILSRERTAGMWALLPASFLQLLAALLHREPESGPEILADPRFAVHLGCLVLAGSALTLAAIFGFLYTRLMGQLTGGRFSRVYGNLPPLETLERMTAAALGLGFSALTAALATAALWLRALYPADWWRDPRVLLVLATWALYGAGLLLRLRRSNRGPRTALVSLAGLGGVLGALAAWLGELLD